MELIAGIDALHITVARIPVLQNVRAISFR